MTTQTSTAIIFTADKDTKNGKRFTTNATAEDKRTEGYSGSIYLTNAFIEEHQIGETVTLVQPGDDDKIPAVRFTKDKDTKSGIRTTTAATKEEDQTEGVSGSVYLTAEAAKEHGTETVVLSIDEV